MQAGSFSNWKTIAVDVRDLTLVTIPEAANLEDSGKTFEPQVIKVIIGLNNTVRWINQDNTLHWIEADNQSDPAFYNATSDENRKLMAPNESFDYTFTRAGEFGYHGKPHLRGTVVVVPQACGQSIESVKTNAPFTILMPTRLPEGYSLQSVDYVPNVYVIMQYFTRSLCDPNNPYSPDEGVIEIVEAPLSQVSNVKSGREYVQTEMVKYESINFNATSYVFRDGSMYAVGYDTGISCNAHLWVVDDKTGTIVKIEARSTDIPLEQLAEIAESLE